MSCHSDKSTQDVKNSQAQTDYALPVIIKLPCQNNCEDCKKRKEAESTGHVRKLTLMLSAMLISVSGFSQSTTATTPSFWSDPFNHPMLPFYVTMALMGIVILLVMVVALYLIRILNMMVEEAEKEKAAKQGIIYIPKPSWWQKFSQQVNASIPLEQEQSIDLGHSYDGIRELDNHLPPWWKYLFYATIVWSIVYLFVYHLSDSLPLSEQEYQKELADAEEQARKFKASQPQAVIDESTLAYTNDQALIEKGKSVFMNNNCGSCHRNDGGGNAIGPNLTDEYWIHGGDIKNIFSTIKNGAVEKGMPAWGKAMSPQDVRDVTFFVMSLQGTKPANPKAPQGDLFQQQTIQADTTKRASL